MSMPLRLRTLDGFRFVARAAGALAILIGGIVLAGWAFDIEAAKSGIPGMVAMNPGGTALAVLLAGCRSGFSRRRPAVGSAPSAWRAPAWSFCWRCSGSAAIGSPGITAPTNCYSGRSWTWRACAPASPTGWRPTRRRPCCWSAWPCCSWTSRSRRGVLAAQFLALATALIALLAIIGYAYSALALARIEQFIPMALNTALALGLLGVGILCAVPDRGVMAVVTSTGAGGVMARRLLPAVIVIPPRRGWVCWLGQQKGVLDQVMGLSLFVVTNIVIFTALIWWNAASLDRMDRKRRRAERRLGIQYTATRVLADSPGTRRRRAQDLASDLRELGLGGGRHVAG